IFTRCFFFSSRRRHTRSKRDWSSDVCSSDLSSPSFRLRRGDERASRSHPEGSCLGVESRVVGPCVVGGDRVLLSRPVDGTRRARSEERRVGKECIDGKGTDSLKNKIIVHAKS